MASSGLFWWLHIMTAFAVYNTYVGYSPNGLAIYRDLYDLAPSQVTPLSAHCFGTWTSITAAVRIVSAYDIDNRQLYFLNCFTLAAATVKWAMEWLVYETVSSKSVRLPLALDAGTLIYMLYAWPRGPHSRRS